MTDTLNHSLVTATDDDPERWIYVLHGIYGMGRNWATVTRRLVEARPELGAVLVDLRMHGDSQDFSPPHTVEAAADDLEALIRKTGRPADVVLGHSFGGKVALEFTATTDVPPGQTWIIDSTPEARAPSGTAWEVIDTLRSLPKRFDDRAEAVDRLVDDGGYPRPMAQWLAMNLRPGNGGFQWRIDIDAMEELLRDFFDRDLWSVVEDPSGDGELHFVKAEDSETMRPEVVERIEAASEEGARVFLHRLPGGHWLNAENPDGMVDLLSSRIDAGD